MKTRSLIILDLDGTLVDSKADLCRSVNHVRGHFGLQDMGEDSITNLIGNGAARLIQGALESASEQDVGRGLELFLEYYREHMLDESRLYPGVRETLAELSDANLAVLTNKPCRFSQLMLQRLGIYECFHAVYGGNSFNRKKPDPIGVFQLLSETEADRGATWIVGDSSVDVETGRNAGVRTCGVSYGYAPDTFVENPPDHVIDAFHHLPNIVR